MTDTSSDDYATAGGYPIGLVSTLTGLSADVIRIWERRYGLPRPARTIGGHRLYSPRDVALLRRAAKLRIDGLTAASACAQALAEAAPVSGGREMPPDPGMALSLSDRLHDAAIDLDAARVGSVLAEAGALLDIMTLWRQVVAPALTRLGAGWEHGAHTAAPEHLLSGLIRGRLSALLEAAPQRPGAPKALLGAAPGERHDLAVLMLAVLLSRSGWTTMYLGADTPDDAWEEAVRSVRPRVAIVSATMPANAVAGLQALRGVWDRFGDRSPYLAVGGPAFSSVSLSEYEAPAFTQLADDIEDAARDLAALS